MRKLLQILLLFLLTSQCFGEGSLQLLFETSAEKKARKDYKIKRDQLQRVTMDNDMHYAAPDNQIVDFCNPGDAKKFFDIPVMYGAIVEASLDSVIPLPPDSIVSEDQQDLYEKTLKKYGSPEIRTKTLTFQVHAVLNPATNTWEEAPADSMTVTFNVRRGVAIDEASGEFRLRESNIMALNNYVFTPYGYYTGWYADSVFRNSCAERKSIELTPYEMAFPILGNLEYHYRTIAQRAAKGDFDFVAEKSQKLLDDLSPSGNVFNLRGLDNREVILPLLILARRYTDILLVPESFMDFMDDYYYLHEENRETGMGDVTSVSPYLLEALQSWQDSKTEQANFSKQSPEVKAYVSVIIARSMGVSQSELNKVVKKAIRGINEGAKAFIVRHFLSEVERGGIGNIGFSYGKPMALDKQSRDLLDGDFSADFFLDFETNYIVYGFSLGATLYDYKDDSEDSDYELRSLRFNINLGYRPFSFSYLDTYLYGSLILEENLFTNKRGSGGDSTVAAGFAVGGVFDFFFTPRHVVSAPAVPGRHSFVPPEPGKVGVKPAVGFSRPGLRLRVEYSMQKLLDEYRSGLDISLGLIWNFYGYKQREIFTL